MKSLYFWMESPSSGLPVRARREDDQAESVPLPSFALMIKHVLLRLFCHQTLRLPTVLRNSGRPKAFSTSTVPFQWLDFSRTQTVRSELYYMKKRQPLWENAKDA